VDGQAFALALAGELRAALLLMQAARSGEGRPLVMGKPADYNSAFFAPGPGISRGSRSNRSAHGPVAPCGAHPTATPPGVGGQASSQGGGMLCERLSSRHDPVGQVGAIKFGWRPRLTGLRAGATAKWRAVAFQGS